jgi:hypothetical protein
MLLLDDPACPYCGMIIRRNWPHDDAYHAYWYRYWLRRLAVALRKLDVWGQSRV